MYIEIVERLKNQLIEKGIPRNNAGYMAINLLKKQGILDDNGLTNYGKIRDSMSPEQRGIDRAVKGVRTHSDYVYNSETNRATRKP
jgi:hypothetical protein